MRVLTERDLIREFLEKLAHNLGYVSGRILAKNDNERRAKKAKLIALDPETVTLEEVEAIVGRTIMYSIECSECHKNGIATEFLEVGFDLAYEQSYTYICKDCLYKGLEMLTNPVVDGE